MNTVTIYKITVTQAYSAYECGDRYSLEPWGEDTDYYSGYDDGGVEYLLPEGYKAYTARGGYKAILNPRGFESYIEVGCTGPVMYDSQGKRFELKRA